MFENVSLKNARRFLDALSLNLNDVQNALDKVVNTLKPNLPHYMGKFPKVITGSYKEAPSHWSRNRYIPTEMPNWGNSMWTGLYWLIYELTGDNEFKNAAISQVEVFKKVLAERYQLNDHDTGFKFIPSCVAAYKVTGDREARDAAIEAADIMFEHYCQDNGFIIRSGKGTVDEPYEFYRTLVDSMMNIPLFFWASEETGDTKYKEAAVRHYNTTLKYLIRDDGSSYHHYQFDPKTKKAVKGMTLQGNRDESCWSRGQAWLVYGYPIAYSYTGDEKIFDIHRAVTYYFLNNLPSDFVPYWDFDFNDGSLESRDSSASAIACCGLMEMDRYLPDTSPDKEVFKKASDCMLGALIEKCTPENEPYDNLLTHVTGSRPHNSVDSVTPYGDYFYAEALIRKIRPDFRMYW